MVKEKLNILAKILIVIAVIMILIGICYTLYDFYNDYRCSTTQDTKWFTDNNCMRYMR